MEDIHQKGAYFISRLKPKTTIYELKEGNYIRLEVNELYNELKRSKRTCLEKQVHIGPKKVPVRLVAELLPDSVVEERLRRAKKQAVKKGRNVSKQYKSFAQLNLFLTNLSKKDLSIEQVHDLYRLRWQVELVFKTWKGYFNFHRFKKMQRYRLESYLYASLLFIISGWELYYRLSSLIWREKQTLISKMKFAKAWVQSRTKWRELLSYSNVSVENFIKNTRDYCLDFLVQEKRKNRYNLEDYLMLNS